MEFIPILEWCSVPDVPAVLDNTRTSPVTVGHQWKAQHDFHAILGSAPWTAPMSQAALFQLSFKIHIHGQLAANSHDIRFKVVYQFISMCVCDTHRYMKVPSTGIHSAELYKIEESNNAAKSL